jgi:hypothetical protein
MQAQTHLSFAHQTGVPLPQAIAIGLHSYRSIAPKILVPNQKVGLA